MLKELTMVSNNPLKILIVDDEVMVRENLEAYFEDEGYEVRTFETGEDAVKFLKNEHMDVGIIDLRLPGIDGDTTIVKSHNIQPDMKFIIYTGSTSYNSVPDELIQLGMTMKNIYHKTTMDMTILADGVNSIIQPADK